MAPERLRVVTLNIWNRSGPWDRRLVLIRNALAALDPGIVGLQEVLCLAPTGPPHGRWKADETAGLDSLDQASAIAAGGGFQLAYAPAWNMGGGLYFGNALMSRWEIIEQAGFPLPDGDSGESRCLLYALVNHPAGPLPVFVTHLNWKLHHGAVRRRQVQFIVERIFETAPVRDDTLPAILMGDFNAEPDSDEIRYLRGLATLDGRSVYFADVWTYAGQGPGYTFDRRNRFAALAHEPPRRIDYIFVRGPDRQLRGEPIMARLAFDEPEADEVDSEIWPSDHFGVAADVVVSGRAS